MNLRSRLADHQSVGNFAVGQPIRQQSNYFALARGQAIGGLLRIRIRRLQSEGPWRTSRARLREADKLVEAHAAPGCVSLFGSQALLEQGSQQLQLRVLEPTDAVLRVDDVNLTPPQKPTTGVRKLSLQLSTAATSSRIAVLFAPGADSGASVQLTPLEQWQLINENRSRLDGKVVIDPSNPIAPDGQGGFKRTLPDGVSAGAR